MVGRDDASPLPPLELLERLASLTPRPRINLILYHGVLGALAAWRSRLPRPGVAVPTATVDTVVDARADSARPIAPTGRTLDPPPSAPAGAARSGSNWLWAELMRRSFPPSLGFTIHAELWRDLAEALPPPRCALRGRVARRRAGSTRSHARAAAGGFVSLRSSSTARLSSESFAISGSPPKFRRRARRAHRPAGRRRGTSPHDR
jgi:hypothetical protein